MEASFNEEPYIEKANAAESEYKAAAAKVNADINLSPEGKQEKIKQLEATWRDQATAIQEDALRAVDSKLKSTQADIKTERFRQVHETRKALGDTVYASLLQEEVKAAPDEAALIEMVLNAPEDFTKMVTGRAALARVVRRSTLEEEDAYRQISAALYGERIGTLNEVMTDLGHVRTAIERDLDPDYEAKLRQRMRL